MKLENKIAVVTGSSRGIGRTISRFLAQEGAKVVINGRNGKVLEKTYSQFRKEGLSVSACPGDVSQLEDCKKLIEYAIDKYGKLDILINNAGLGSRGFVEETNPEVFRHLVDVNLLGSLYPTLFALPFVKHSQGSITFISSLAGLRGLPNRCPYSMTKMAQTSIAESMRAELYPKKVHIGIVYVGMTKSDPEKRIIFPDGTTKKLLDRKFLDSQETVAKVVLKSIKKRQFKTIVGAKGKAFYFLQNFAPWLVDLAFRNAHVFIKKYDV